MSAQANSNRDWGNWSSKLPPSHYIDNTVYLSPEIHELERRNVFGKVWAFVAHESEVPEAGDFITTTLAGTPLVLVRDQSGKLRAFLNVCPHRGATLVREPSGKVHGFTCLFHQWSFDINGRCRAVPNPEGYREVGLGPELFGLKEFRCEKKLGLVFVTLDDTAQSLESFLGHVLGAVEDVISPCELEVFHFNRIILPTNWKLWAATNVELYHIWLHSINRDTSLKAPNFLERTVSVYPNGHVAFDPVKHVYEKRGLGTRDLTLPGLRPNEARLAHVFPDLLINIRSSSMRLDRVTPLSATEVMVECRGLGIKGEAAEDRQRRINEHNELWGPFGRNLPEDGLAAVAQMQAIKGGAMPHALCARGTGTTPAMSDEPLRHFQQQWSALMHGAQTVRADAEAA